MPFELNPNLGQEIVESTMARIGEQMSLTEMCTPAFMVEHTSFATIQEMVDASPLSSAPQEELVAALRSDADDEFVLANSRFRTWRQLYMEAARLEVRRRLKATG